MFILLTEVEVRCLQSSFLRMHKTTVFVTDESFKRCLWFSHVLSLLRQKQNRHRFSKISSFCTHCTHNSNRRHNFVVVQQNPDLISLNNWLWNHVSNGWTDYPLEIHIFAILFFTIILYIYSYSKTEGMHSVITLSPICVSLFCKFLFLNVFFSFKLVWFLKGFVIFLLKL